MSREDAFEAIAQLRKDCESQSSKIHKANEAATRLLVIDRVLEALGWPRQDFNPEVKAGKGNYIDYLLEVDGIPRLIVEAKRVGITFSSPAKRSQRNHYQLRYFRSAFRTDFASVLEQAQRYVSETGVPFAVITNGAEWLLVQLLAAPGVTDINDLQGIYFGNLFSEDFNFDLLWEVLCRDYVGQGSLEANLGALNLKQADFCMTPQVGIGHLSWHASIDNQQLWDLYDRFFDEIIDPGRRKMLEKCFVSNSKLDHFQAELQRALRDTAPSYVSPVDPIEITPDEGRRLITSSSGDKKGRVAIVTGSVGCGKSTFVTRVLVDVKKEKKESLAAVKVDLIDEAMDDSARVVPDLWKYIAEQWKKAAPESYENETLRKIFGRQLLELRQGPYKEIFAEDGRLLLQREADLLDKLVTDPEVFFRECWRYYQQKGRGVVVFLDNVDRASESYQQQVYAFAHKLARETGATVIVTMREFTFFRGRDAGFLDVRTDDIVFHLQSPNLLQLLSRRIKYVEEYIDEDNRLSQLKKTQDWDSFYASALRHCALLKQVFLKDHSDGNAILALLSAVAWHDVRYFLKALRHLHTHIGTDDRPWTLSETIAALLAPSENGAPILGSLYYPSFRSYKCYFLRLRAILLMQYGRVHHKMKRGTSFREIEDLLKQYGYQRRWIQKTLEELVQERFLECVEAPAAEDYTKSYKVSEKHTFRPSPLAIVCIEEGIVSDATYLAFIGGDLPFHDKNKLAQYEQSVKEFCSVLDEQQLSRDAIGIMAETRATNIVANYLSETFFLESPSQNIADHVPEVAAIEQKLKTILTGLKTHVTAPPRPRSMGAGKDLQLPLFGSHHDIALTSGPADALPIPKDIESMRVGRSEMVPLIYWALVYLSLKGNSGANGVEITNVINEFLVEEHNQKASNNVSRALRSELLHSEGWLVAQKRSPRNTLFRVVDNWRDYWQRMFGDLPPAS